MWESIYKGAAGWGVNTVITGVGGFTGGIIGVQLGATSEENLKNALTGNAIGCLAGAGLSFWAGTKIRRDPDWKIAGTVALIAATLSGVSSLIAVAVSRQVTTTSLNLAMLPNPASGLMIRYLARNQVKALPLRTGSSTPPQSTGRATERGKY